MEFFKQFSLVLNALDNKSESIVAESAQHKRFGGYQVDVLTRIVANFGACLVSRG